MRCQKNFDSGLIIALFCVSFNHALSRWVAETTDVTLVCVKYLKSKMSVGSPVSGKK